MRASAAEDAEDAAPSEAAAARAPRRGGVAERLVDDLKDRDAEGARLAAASLGGGEHVAAAQDEGDSLRLHGGGGGANPARPPRE